MGHIVNAVVLIIIGLALGYIIMRMSKEDNEAAQIKKRVQKIGEMREQLKADKQTSAEKVSEYEKAKADYLNLRGDK